MKGLEVKGLDIIGKLKEKPESLNRRDDTQKVIKHAMYDVCFNIQSSNQMACLAGFLRTLDDYAKQKSGHRSSVTVN